MKKVTDHIHQIGKIAELHSCGNHGAHQIENIIDAGWDIWQPQPMNDVDTLWERYGDKILLCPKIEEISDGTPEDVQIACADRFVEKYCMQPGKPITLAVYHRVSLQPAFRKEASPVSVGA